MKILQLYYKMPFPQNDGGAYSVYHSSLSLLSQQTEVKILAMNLLSSESEISQIPENFFVLSNFEYVNVDNRVKVWDALKNLFGQTSYFVDRFYSEAFRKKLVAILQNQNFDIVQLEHLYLCLYLADIRKYTKAKIVLRPQNVENQLWRSYLQKVKNPLVKAFLSVATKRLKHFEKQVIGQLDGIIALSEIDAAYFKQHAAIPAVTDIPLAIDMSRYANVDLDLQYQDFPSLYHLGSMDWKPNIQGMQWFITKVLPPLRLRHPDVRVYMAGKKMKKWFFNHRSIFLHIDGTVDDAIKYQEDKAILFVPLLTGSGIRVKILEGMALGKTIISTTIGAQGISVTNGKDILIADTPEFFVDQISRCLHSESFCRSIGNNARKLAFEKYEISAIGKKMVDFYTWLINE
jgi:glycosyltransferase involved in cell wall biosynthesis